jgi:hypothetical protein
MEDRVETETGNVIFFFQLVTVNMLPWTLLGYFVVPCTPPPPPLNAEIINGGVRHAGQTNATTAKERTRLRCRYGRDGTRPTGDAQDETAWQGRADIYASDGHARAVK